MFTDQLVICKRAENVTWGEIHVRSDFVYGFDHMSCKYSNVKAQVLTLMD